MSSDYFVTDVTDRSRSNVGTQELRANVCNRRCDSSEQVRSLTIGSPIVWKVSTWVGEDCGERFRCPEPHTVDLIGALSNRIECAFDRCPETLPLNDDN